MSSQFRRDRGFRPPPTKDTHRINDRITAREVRVVAADGTQLGVLSLPQALAATEQADLDLVEVAPNSNPPVCRIMNYGKFKYQEQKKLADARKRQTEVVIKELRLRYSTDVGDLDTKLRKAREFLAENDKVKFSMRFRGREIAYMHLGREKLQSVIEALSDVAVVDEPASEFGRQIHLTLAPKKK